jgi:hypothetical protein
MGQTQAKTGVNKLISCHDEFRVMTRNSNLEPLGMHVRRSIAAANMTMAQLIREYPHITPEGYMRPTDNGLLYRRVGIALLQLPAPLLEKLLVVETNIGWKKLRKLGNRKRSLQENISKVRLLIIELSARKPLKTKKP